MEENESLEDIEGVKPKDGIKTPNEEKKYNKIKGVLLSLPMVVSSAILVLLIRSQNTLSFGGVMLSPGRDSTPLIMGVLIFMVGYMVFIGMIYSNALKDFLRYMLKLLHLR